MVNKENIEKLIKEEKYADVIEIFSKEYLENFKSILDYNNIVYNSDITLIECISLLEFKIPESMSIIHIPTEVVYSESREIDSRANLALNWYDKWLEAVENLKN